MLNRMLLEKVGLVRASAGTRDQFGNESPGEETVQTVAGWVEPRTHSQQAGLREGQIVYGYRVFVDDQTSLDGVVAVIWRGSRYRLTGKPLLQPGGFRLSGFWKADLEAEEG